MINFVLFLIKYTAIFVCSLYVYSKLLRIKLSVWDLFDIPLFIALSAVLYFATVYVKILVPIGFFIFVNTFLLLRFGKSFCETVTVGTIALGISIVLMLPSSFVGFFIAQALHQIEAETVREIIAQSIDSLIQIAGIWLLFKIKRLQSGINMENKDATLDILLYLSVICIFTMMLLYAEEVKQYMLKIVLLVIGLCGLLLILWWRRHITYTFRGKVKKKDFERLEERIEEYKLNSAETDLQVAVYAKLVHYLNKTVPDCAILAESAAVQTGCADACGAADMLRSILREMNIANEKCSFRNIPKTGVSVIDAPIIRLYAAAERKSFDARAEISADVKSWFADDKLHKEDINILLSYLCDNAMISALGLPNAKVRAELGLTADKKPLIRIYDSGGQFDGEVLGKLGLEQVTTRAGGSGIGLFTVFEILKKYGASFTLDEAPQSFGFTKFIEIAFDGRNAVLVRTLRESVVEACSARKGITVELIDGYDGETLRDGTDG